jgi:hypothetical protein
MKYNFNKIISVTLLLIVPLLITAQPPHPNGGNTPNTTTNTKVGDQPSAPLDNGTFILFAFALAYAGRKLYELRSIKEE